MEPLQGDRGVGGTGARTSTRFQFCRLLQAHFCAGAAFVGHSICSLAMATVGVLVLWGNVITMPSGAWPPSLWLNVSSRTKPFYRNTSDIWRCTPLCSSWRIVAARNRAATFNQRRVFIAIGETGCHCFCLARFICTYRGRRWVGVMSS